METESDFDFNLISHLRLKILKYFPCNPFELVQYHFNYYFLCLKSHAQHNNIYWQHCNKKREIGFIMWGLNAWCKWMQVHNVGCHVLYYWFHKSNLLHYCSLCRQHLWKSFILNHKNFARFKVNWVKFTIKF
jgi:hypothetical protein